MRISSLSIGKDMSVLLPMCMRARPLSIRTVCMLRFCSDFTTLMLYTVLYQRQCAKS